MFGLIGYALLSIITTLVLSPVIKFGKGFSSYLCVFGMVYLVVLFISPHTHFEPNWFKFIGYFLVFMHFYFYIFSLEKNEKATAVS